jgi:hypothetical protein
MLPLLYHRIENWLTHFQKIIKSSTLRTDGATILLKEEPLFLCTEYAQQKFFPLVVVESFIYAPSTWVSPQNMPHSVSIPEECPILRNSSVYF